MAHRFSGQDPPAAWNRIPPLPALTMMVFAVHVCPQAECLSTDDAVAPPGTPGPGTGVYG